MLRKFVNAFAIAIVAMTLLFTARAFGLSIFTGINFTADAFLLILLGAVLETYYLAL